MARIRYAQLRTEKAETSSADGGTITIDLPEKGILTELTVQARSLGAYSAEMVLPMHAIIKKLEVLVDGSTVIKSLTGTQAKALEWYNGGPFSMDDSSQFDQNHMVHQHSFPLYLNRFSGDTKAGLAMAMYANPQLKITWDTTTTSLDGQTFAAHTDPTFTSTVIAKMIDGTPSGFTNKYVQSSEIDTWDNSTSSQHNTEIPRGFDLKGLMWRAAYQAIKPEELLNNIRLDFDNGTWVPLDMDYAQFWQTFLSWYPKPVEVNRWVTIHHGDMFDPRVLKLAHFDASSADSTTIHATLTSGRSNMQTITAVKASATPIDAETGIWTHSVGFGPHQALYIPMSQLVDGDQEAIPTRDYARIDLKTKTGASSGTSGIQHLVAEYLKPNGQ